MFIFVKFVFNLTNDKNHKYMSAKLRTQKTKAGDYSIYIDVYQKGQKRVRESLNLRVSKPYDSSSKRIESKDKETWTLAEKILEQRNLDLKAVQYNITNFTKGKASAFPYLMEKALTKNHDLYPNAVKSFFRFIGERTSFNKINSEMVNEFIEFLQKEKMVHDNTVRHYIRALTHLWKFALKDKFISHNPFDLGEINKPKEVESKREFLNIEEIRKISQCEQGNQVVKRAFLFACFTGLRISDVRKLQWKEIRQDENGDFYIDYRQQKTASLENLPLSSSAIKILNEIPKENDYIFYNLPTKTAISKTLQAIAKYAGIDKHIHFHVSRHTFATLAITYDNDIYTVSKLLGHKKVATTQIYAKIVDEKKREAVNKLPEL